METLLVMAAFLTMSVISVVLLRPEFFLLEKNLFIAELKSDLLFAQQYAISHQQEVNVHIMPEKSYYYIYTRGDGPLLVEKTYSSAVKLEGGSMTLYFRFLPDGNVNRFGSFYAVIGGKKYRITIMIGKGRLYVAEE
ncbi:competence type IV pilus minor pilin ComGD [Bacillus sp. T33-2]|uniref:competence type IV pilus minor pilin ComGD n=1 Tax=Bacillus sp. T33-2 TaxID=2054168 RepID=UPI002155ED07|nr:competence type IV pilus minor pilin ComGD [Bacillus sp. T33-2]